MKYSIGTPPVPILGVADTGSDLIWLQCEPCTTVTTKQTPFLILRSRKHTEMFLAVQANASPCKEPHASRHHYISTFFFMQIRSVLWR
jgi:hypothetical protein